MLACGAMSSLRLRARGRGAALAATGFAIAGVLYGLSITTQGGDLPDIVYHATLLPVLIVTFALLLRTGKHSAGNRAAPEPSRRAVRPGPWNGPQHCTRRPPGCSRCRSRRQ